MSVSDQYNSVHCFVFRMYTTSKLGRIGRTNWTKQCQNVTYLCHLSPRSTERQSGRIVRFVFGSCIASLLLRIHKNRHKVDNSRWLPCAFVFSGDIVCFQRRPVRHNANYVPLLICANARLFASLYRSLLYCIYSAFLCFSWSWQTFSRSWSFPCPSSMTGRPIVSPFSSQRSISSRGGQRATSPTITISTRATQVTGLAFSIH